MINIPSFVGDQMKTPSVLSRYLKLAYVEDTTFNDEVLPRCEENATLTICTYNQTIMGPVSRSVWQSGEFDAFLQTQTFSMISMI